jgi:hypothetical protein
MKWRHVVLIVVVCVSLVVSAVLIAAARQPDTLTVTRSLEMPVPAGQVFPLVNDLHQMQAWSPWAKLDPQATNTFEGPESGPGAVFRWSGNSSIGEGSMEITDSVPDEQVDILLSFVQPFQSQNNVSFTFEPQGDGTLVTWTMTGEANLVTKVLSLFVDMSQMVGGQFEEGLNNLKQAALARAPKSPEESSDTPQEKLQETPAEKLPEAPEATPSSPSATEAS